MTSLLVKKLHPINEGRFTLTEPSLTKAVVVFMKKVLTFIFTMLAAGTGLSLYLPPYKAPPPPVLQYTVVESTLIQPPTPSSILLSNLLLEDDATAKSFAIQLGLYANIDDAIIGANTLATRQLELPQLPAIFKVEDALRQWYILSLGPYITKSESSLQKIKLDTAGIPSQIILWPVEKDDKPNT